MGTYVHFRLYVSRFFLERKIFQRKVVEKRKTHILCSVTFFFENRTLYEIMWKNIVEWGRPQMAVWRMRIACWIPKPADTHSEYVILGNLLNCALLRRWSCRFLYEVVTLLWTHAEPEKWSQKNYFEKITSKKNSHYCEDGGSRSLRDDGNNTLYGKRHAEHGSSGLLRNISTCDTTRRHIRYNSRNFHRVENIKSYPQKIILRIYTWIMFHVSAFS
jgi:hypothetical protein